MEKARVIVIAGHATRINEKIYEAPTHVLLEVLCQELKSDLVYLRYAIDGRYPGEIHFYQNGKLLQKKTVIFPFARISFLRYVEEVLFTSYFLCRTSDLTYYVGVDPLNALAGCLSRFFLPKLQIIFYSVDYSTQRFGNRMLNWIYQSIDSYVARRATQVWNVSRRIQLIHARVGVKSKKNLFLPNVPSETFRTLKSAKKRPFTLVTAGSLNEQIDYLTLCNAIKELRSEFPKIVLKIIGNGPMEDTIRTFVTNNHLKNRIKLLGYLPHPQAMKEIATSSVGLALYNGKWSFNYYGDSMKCREFLYFGLPVITTDTHATVDEVREYAAGVIVDTNLQELSNATKQVLTHYTTYQRSAKKLGNKYINLHRELLVGVTTQ